MQEREGVTPMQLKDVRTLKKLRGCRGEFKQSRQSEAGSDARMELNKAVQFRQV
jgi:hypothetical protein